MGEPRNCFSRIFGPTGSYLRMIWRYLAPLESLVNIYTQHSPFTQFILIYFIGYILRHAIFPDHKNNDLRKR